MNDGPIDGGDQSHNGLDHTLSQVYNKVKVQALTLLFRLRTLQYSTYFLPRKVSVLPFDRCLR